MTIRSPDYLRGLVREFCKLPNETEWLEFKRNNDNPQEIGEYVSALANAATLAGKAQAYVIWGIEDASRDIVGTTFRPGSAKKGNEEFESWLLRLLDPKIGFRFFEVDVDGKHIVILEIDRATRQPVRFSGKKYIRVGSYKKVLKQCPEKERELWRLFDQTPFESLAAAEHVSDDDVLSLLSYPSYFDLLDLPLPEGRQGILAALADDNVIQRCDAGGWNISNLGAVLFAKRLDKFPGLARKAMRVISYHGNSRAGSSSKEQLGVQGYATGFEGMMGYISGLVPENEVIGKALRKTVPMYPELALREVVANALIHQEFFVKGAGPMVELFTDRIEIANPGAPLVSIERFLDTPPRSRNEALASLMRRMGICEERGSGVDKIVDQTEFYQLPAPLFEVVEGSTRVTLFAHRALTKMDKEDRVRVCYLHACLKHVNREYLTNSSMRERFGIEKKNSALSSRLIKEAVQAGKIAPHDPTAAPKLMKYVPWWAGAQSDTGDT